MSELISESDLLEKRWASLSASLMVSVFPSWVRKLFIATRRMLSRDLWLKLPRVTKG